MCTFLYIFLQIFLDFSLLDELLELGFRFPLVDPVEMVDSAGELALDNWARLSRNAAVSPSVKLKKNK